MHVIVWHQGVDSVVKSEFRDHEQTCLYSVLLHLLALSLFRRHDRDLYLGGLALLSAIECNLVCNEGVERNGVQRDFVARNDVKNIELVGLAGLLAHRQDLEPA